VKVVLLRHGECLGNVDESAYTRIPDHALALTAHGEQQAMAAGPRIKELVGDARLGVYVSPYRRTLRTFALLGLAPAWTVQEPRLREQDWGNLQDAEGQRRHREERDFFGHFFYRLPNGESGADVDDRLAAFLDGLEVRLHKDERHPKTVLVVSHGLTIRLLCRRLFDWSIELFESLSNVDTCENRVLDHDGTGWRLDRPFDQWRDSPDGTVQLPIQSSPRL
jgi:broad specificity phosphatase PhoE